VDVRRRRRRIFDLLDPSLDSGFDKNVGRGGKEGVGVISLIPYLW